MKILKKQNSLNHSNSSYFSKSEKSECDSELFERSSKLHRCHLKNLCMQAKQLMQKYSLKTKLYIAVPINK